MTKTEYIEQEARAHNCTPSQFRKILKRNNEEVVKCNCYYPHCSGYIIQTKQKAI